MIDSPPHSTVLDQMNEYLDSVFSSMADTVPTGIMITLAL